MSLTQLPQWRNEFFCVDQILSYNFNIQTYESHLTPTSNIWVSPDSHIKHMSLTWLPHQTYESHLTPTSNIWVSPDFHIKHMSLTWLPHPKHMSLTWLQHQIYESHLTPTSNIWVSPDSYIKHMSLTWLPHQTYESHLTPTSNIWVSPDSHIKLMSFTWLPTSKHMSLTWRPHQNIQVSPDSHKHTYESHLTPTSNIRDSPDSHIKLMSFAWLPHQTYEFHLNAWFPQQTNESHLIPKSGFVRWNRASQRGQVLDDSMKPTIHFRQTAEEKINPHIHWLLVFCHQSIFIMKRLKYR